MTLFLQQTYSGSISIMVAVTLTSLVDAALQSIKLSTDSKTVAFTLIIVLLRPQELYEDWGGGAAGLWIFFPLGFLRESKQVECTAFVACMQNSGALNLRVLIVYTVMYGTFLVPKNMLHCSTSKRLTGVRSV